MFDLAFTGKPNNPVLVQLMAQADDLEKDDKKNCEAIVIILARILKLAKAEREHTLYISALKSMIYYADRNGDGDVSLKYCELFFRTCAQYLSITPRPSQVALRKIAYGYHNAFMSCHRFAQIDDAKMTQFLSYFRSACEKGGLMVLYWMSVTDLSLTYSDLESAKHAAQQLEKQPLNMLCCYACRKQSVMGTYILLNDLPSCLHLVQHILNREFPQKYFERDEDCSRMTLRGLYNDLVNFSLWAGNQEALDYFVRPFVEACHTEHIRDTTTLCYCHAALGDFTHLAEDLAYMVTTEMDKNADERARWSAWDTAITSLVWVSFMKKLLQCDIEKIALPSLPEDLSFPMQDGQYLVQPLLEWWEARADNAGHTFETSRAKFHYSPLKANYLRLCGVS